MRLLPTVILCLALIGPVGYQAAAQGFVATPVEISTDKVNVKGTVYWLHKVLKGHTLYSISKAYGVSVDEIKAANPSLSEGLKAGTLIYIPDKAATTGTVTADQPENTSVTTEQPTNEKPQKKVVKDKKKYKKYNVKWYETLDDVAVKFNVTVEAIIALNDIDTVSGKRIRSVMIPDKEYMRSMETGQPDTTGETAGEEEDRIPVVTFPVTEQKPVPENGVYTISLVLPFNASGRTDNINAYAADFYAGVLTAAADLKEKGLFSGFELNVVDLSRYGSAWELIADNVLNDSELIIGPISERDMQPIASYARSRQIPVVSPLDLGTETLAQDNPWFYLFPPQSDLALAHQLDKIADTTDADTVESVTVIYEQGYDRSDEVTGTFAGLNERGVKFRTFKYDFLSGRGIDTLMSRSLDSLTLNKVIIPSMSEAFITDALRNLNLIKSGMGYNIEVYGLSRWKSFETIEQDYFHALDLRLAMSYYIDYNRPEVMDFINKYRAAFNTEPSSFSFQGYDIMTFFVNAMNTWGTDFPSGIINERKSLLQSDVLFLPVSSGSGYENRAFKDICFTDNWLVTEE